MVNKIFFTGGLLLCMGCYKEREVATDEMILSIQDSPATTPADGINKTLISVEIPYETSDAANSIVLATTKSQFDIVARNTVTIAAQDQRDVAGKWHKIATTYLLSTNDEVPAMVSVTIKGRTQWDTVYYTRVYADLLKVNVDKPNYAVGSGAEITVTTQVKKLPNAGQPSTGQVISIDAYDSSYQRKIGSFRNKNLQLDASGSCVNYFSMPYKDSSYTGKVRFVATVPRDGMGALLADTNSINIVK